MAPKLSSSFSRDIIDHLRSCQVPISKGLSSKEFSKIQSDLGFVFPPDLRAVLQQGLPVGTGFPEWRSKDLRPVMAMLNLPIAGLCRAVQAQKFWCRTWGPRPKNIDQAVEIAASALNSAPILIPIFGHFYLPASPNLSGNPVLFVHQMDVFYSGFDLADFFDREAFRAEKIQKAEKVQGPKQLRRLKSLKDNLEENGWSTAMENDVEALSRSSEAFTRSTINPSGSVVSSRRSLDSAMKTAEFSSFDLQPCRKSTDAVYRDGQNRGSVSASSLASKNLRRIQFWSELVEQRIQKQESLFPSDLFIDFKLAESSSKPKWLSGYLQDMAGTLRNGGWEEEEIAEMIGVPRSSPAPSESQEKCLVPRNLACKVDDISKSLEYAGFSIQDVAKALGSEQNAGLAIGSAPYPARIGRLGDLIALPEETIWRHEKSARLLAV